MAICAAAKSGEVATSSGPIQPIPHRMARPQVRQIDSSSFLLLGLFRGHHVVDRLLGEWGGGRLSELAGVALIDGEHERASLALSIPMGVFYKDARAKHV